MKEVYEKLACIQQEIKAPKDHKNDFGGFNYRSLEDICKAAKPVLKKHKCTLWFDDEPVVIGGRFYIQANVTLACLESGKTITSKAYAREPEHKTKSDDAQVTGASSSYARKYAVSALFLLDDNQDPDMVDNTEAPKKEELPKEVTDMIKVFQECDLDPKDREKLVDAYKKAQKTGDYKFYIKLGNQVIDSMN